LYQEKPRNSDLHWFNKEDHFWKRMFGILELALLYITRGRRIGSWDRSDLVVVPQNVHRVSNGVVLSSPSSVTRSGEISPFGKKHPQLFQNFISIYEILCCPQ
jgi:hypothetical protein